MARVDISAIQLFRYTLPLDRPLALRGQTLQERHGLLILVSGEGGMHGWGEIAPLPGFSDESLAPAEQQARELRFSLTGSTIPENLEELSGGFEQWLGRYELLPSVQCGLEMAVLHLLANSQERPLANLLSDTARSGVSVNALLPLDSDKPDTQISRLIENGYGAVKVKVGAGALDDEISRVCGVCEAAAGRVSVRLDANRAWSYDDAAHFLGAIADRQIAYIEEPLRDPSRLPELASRTGVPVALDETLRDLTPEGLPAFPGLAAVIVRPMLLGGLERSMRFARRARTLGVIPVLSSAVESAIGIAGLVSFAAAMTVEDIPCGLDTLSWFSRQPTTAPFRIRDGVLTVADAAAAIASVDYRMLEEITDA
ncbi:o-succinylbenzoate synthase [candidate division GN15 bacterium]|nr:o-succinylbenzoate synthase [candidate division GN15 bacterium]